MNRCKDLDAAIAQGLGASGANLPHQPRIYHICSILKPKVIVETGVGTEGHGSSTHTFFLVCRDFQSRLFSIDDQPREEWVRKRNGDLTVDWTFIQGNSEDVLANLPDAMKPIDFLHLDSDHTETHVTKELELTHALMAEKHVITSHDTQETGAGPAFRKFAEKYGYAIREFTDSHGQIFLTKPEYSVELFGGLE